MIRFVPWSEVGTITVSPGDNVIEVGAFELAEGADTLWVRMTNTGTPGPWPWSYGILSFKTDEGQPLGSIKAYNSFDGEVFRLGVGLPPSVRAGVLTFEPRGFNMAWIKQGNPWSLKFEAQSGTSGGQVTNYWNRDPVNGVLSPVTAGDNLAMGTGEVSGATARISGAFFSGAGWGSADLSARISNGTLGLRRDNVSESAIQIYSGGYDAASLTALIRSNGEAFFKSTTKIGNSTAAPKIVLYGSGQASFAGNVSAPNITFRSSDPALMSGEDYIGPELDLLEEIVRLESLVKELYDRLRMSPEAGWPVWDGNEDLINSNIAKSPHI